MDADESAASTVTADIDAAVAGVSQSANYYPGMPPPATNPTGNQRVSGLPVPSFPRWSRGFSTSRILEFALPKLRGVGSPNTPSMPGNGQ